MEETYDNCKSRDDAKEIILRLFGEVKSMGSGVGLKSSEEEEKRPSDVQNKTAEVRKTELDDSGLPDIAEPKNEECLEDVRWMKAELAKVMELMKDFSKTQNEVSFLKQELKKQDARWNEEKNILVEKIKKLESEVQKKKERDRPRDDAKCRPSTTSEENLSQKVIINEKQIKVLKENERERQRKRRRNVIIRNLTTETNINSEDLKEKTNEMFSKVLKTQVKAEKVEIIAHSKTGESIVRAKLVSLQDKLEIMKSKCNLRNYSRRIFIDDDLLKEDRRIQREIQAKVQEQRRNGYYSKAGFRKIYINGEWKVWE